MINEFLNNVRRDFSGKDLELNNTPDSPVIFFEQWFQEAVEAEVMDPNAMNLATVSSDGEPSLRVVLLKHISERGLSFFTDYDSKKGKEIKNNPNVALNFFWVELARQVRVRGKVITLSRQESIEYFNSRPIDSRISAIVSDQSKETSKSALFQKRDEIIEKYKDTDPPCPENWGGFLVIPNYFEFWQGKPSRFHDRLAYTKENNSWSKKILAP